MTVRKRLLTSLLACVLLLGAVLPAAAAETPPAAERTLTISTADELLQFADDCRLDSYSTGLAVTLTADIDLTGIAFDSIPIFGGSFDGRGHTISGLEIKTTGSAQGLFRYITAEGQVRGLTVRGSIHPAGSRSQVGGIAGSNAGLIAGCSFIGQVSGGDIVGGVAGENQVTGIIEDCVVGGSVQGAHFVGGIAGANSGVIRGCGSSADVNVTEQQNTVSLSDITVSTLTGSEFAVVATDIGGIAGTSSGVLRGCINTGDVGYPHMGYNVGGIAGSQTGYITDCENSGSICGRKEVGGIVGQMEPAALLDYDEDTLQRLSRQMQGVSGLVNQTVASVQSAESALVSQVQSLRGHVTGAQDSLRLLLPDRDDPQLPDRDTLTAARNGLSGSVVGIRQAVQGIDSTANSAIDTLTGSFASLQKQLNAITATLNDPAGALGAKITDVSDADTPDELTAKVECCVNTGAVQGDRNVGGIAGAMAVENDLDHEDDLTVQGDASLNIESRLRCVLQGCSSAADVTVQKQAGGGIVGMQSLGLVKRCDNSGGLYGAGAEYVGGIAGQSAGYLRDCNAKGSVAGQRYVGGIAGSAAVVSGCRSAVQLSDVLENAGAVLGSLRPYALQELTEPVADNYYLVLDGDAGGIDGVSYAGQAQPLDQMGFLALEGLSDLFDDAVVTFLFEDGSRRSIRVPVGGELTGQQLPALPQKEGHAAFWDGPQEDEWRNILSDLTFTAVYTAHDATLAGDTVTPDGRPLLLLQGDFLPDAVLSVTPFAQAPALAQGDVLQGCWQFEAAGACTVQAARLYCPQEADPDRLTAFVYSGGSWQPAEHRLDGSYLAIPLPADATALALVQHAPDLRLYYVVGGTLALAVLAAVTMILYRRRKKKKAA